MRVERCAAGRRQDAYPVAAHDVELVPETDERAKTIPALLRTMAEAVDAAAPAAAGSCTRCRKATGRRHGPGPCARHLTDGPVTLRPALFGRSNLSTLAFGRRDAEELTAFARCTVDTVLRDGTGCPGQPHLFDTRLAAAVAVVTERLPPVFPLPLDAVAAMRQGEVAGTAGPRPRLRHMRGRSPATPQKTRPTS